MTDCCRPDCGSPESRASFPGPRIFPAWKTQFQNALIASCPKQSGHWTEWCILPVQLRKGAAKRPQVVLQPALGRSSAVISPGPGRCNKKLC